LLKHRRIITAEDINGRSLLDVALEYKQPRIAKTLLNLNYVEDDNDEMVALLHATTSGDVAMVQLLLDHLGTLSPFVADVSYERACERGFAPIVNLLLRSCSSLSPGEHFVTACRRGHVEVVKELINAGATEHQDPRGFVVELLDPLEPPETEDLGPVWAVLHDADCVVDLSYTYLWESLGRAAPLAMLQTVLASADTADGASPPVVPLALPKEALDAAIRAGRADAAQFLFALASAAGVEVSWLPLLVTSDGGARVAEALLAADPAFLTGLADKDAKQLLQRAVKQGCAGLTAALLREELMPAASLGKLLGITGDAAVVRLLLDAKAVARGPWPVPVLEAACKQLRPDTARLLLDAGAPACVKAPIWTALKADCSESQVGARDELLEMLAAARARVRKTTMGVCPLRECLMDPCEEEKHPAAAVATLLRLFPKLWEHESDDDGNTPLEFALATESVPAAVVKALLDGGAKLPGDEGTGYRYPELFRVLFAEVDDYAQSEAKDAGRALEKTQLLLGAGLDPTVALGDETVVMALARGGAGLVGGAGSWGLNDEDDDDDDDDDDFFDDEDDDGEWGGLTALEMRGREEEDDDDDVFDLRAMGMSGMSREVVFGDAACSVLIGTILDAVLERGKDYESMRDD
jgi:ankyrin repeat protein